MSTFFQEYTRRYNYISDYFHTAFERYISTYPAFPINYYAVDTTNSVWEDDQFRGGSYEKSGVGALSGKKFKKIYELPIFGMTPIQPAGDSGDMGITPRASMQGTMVLPEIYGLKPVAEDIIDINFGFKTVGTPNNVLYIITNVDYAHHGNEFNVYKCDIQVSSVCKTELDSQISKLYRFYEPSKTILPITNVSMLYKMISRSEKNSQNLKTLFNQKCGFYFDEVTL